MKSAIATDGQKTTAEQESSQRKSNRKRRSDDDIRNFDHHRPCESWTNHQAMAKSGARARKTQKEVSQSPLERTHYAQTRAPASPRKGQCCRVAILQRLRRLCQCRQRLARTILLSMAFARITEIRRPNLCCVSQ